MKRALILLSLIVPLAGCNTLKNMISKQPGTPGPAPAADVYTVSGTTSIDYQIIQPVRCVDSAVTVRVKRAGEDWHDCNQYEVKLDTSGPGGGGVWFRRQVELAGGIIYFTSKPVAPAGTQYEIKSIRTSGSSSVELY